MDEVNLMNDGVEEQQNLHWADYLVFAAFLLITTIVGIVIGVVNRRKATAKEFLQAGSEMHFFPVAMSMQASFLSAIFVVSIPAESYNFGIEYAYIILSYFISFPLIGKLILPVFFKLKITSAYEYLEVRFNKAVRTAASITFVLQMLLYISVVIYTPALSIQQVTPLPTYACILLVSGVCIIYTVVGGMRATIWNDLIQMIVVIACLCMLIGFGHSKTGTLREVYHIATNGSRLNFHSFAADPRIRTSFWTQLVGGTFLNFAMYGASQTIIQKALSTRSAKEAQKSMYVLCVTSTVTMLLVMWLGVLMYAFYNDCDPQLKGQVDKPDQVVPKFMMDVMGDLHGLPGLFLASTFSGALSSVSGGLNAMSAVVLVDFIGPIYKHCTDEKVPERLSAILSRVLALIIGVIVAGMSFATPAIGDLILTIALSIFGMVGGPLTGVVSAGLFMPCVNSWGALAGLIISLGLSLWLGIGTMLDGPPLPFLPHSIEGCPNNETFFLSTPEMYSGITDWTTPAAPPVDEVLGFYKLSYMYYGLVAIGIVLVVALLVSAMSGFAKDTPHDHIYSCADTCCCSCCPRNAKDCCRCGSLPPEEDEDSVEIIQVHFKKRAGSDVAGMEHPVRQVSFTITNHPGDVTFNSPDPSMDKNQHSLHTALYNKDSINKANVEEPIISDKAIESSKMTNANGVDSNTTVSESAVIRADSGIVLAADSDKESDRKSDRSGSVSDRGNASCSTLNGNGGFDSFETAGGQSAQDARGVQGTTTDGDSVREGSRSVHSAHSQPGSVHDSHQDSGSVRSVQNDSTSVRSVHNDSTSVRSVHNDWDDIQIDPGSSASIHTDSDIVVRNESVSIRSIQNESSSVQNDSTSINSVQSGFDRVQGVQNDSSNVNNDSISARSFQNDSGSAQMHSGSVRSDQHQNSDVQGDSSSVRSIQMDAGSMKSVQNEYGSVISDQNDQEYDQSQRRMSQLSESGSIQSITKGYEWVNNIVGDAHSSRSDTGDAHNDVAEVVMKEDEGPSPTKSANSTVGVPSESESSHDVSEREDSPDPMSSSLIPNETESERSTVTEGFDNPSFDMTYL